MKKFFYSFLILIFFCQCTKKTFAIENPIEKMSSEEKVGQLFISFIYGETLKKAEKSLINETKLGNFILYNWSNTLSSPSQVQKLTSDLKKYVQKTVGIIPFIAIDQEGGIVSHLQKGYRVFPGNMALVATNNPTLAKCVAKAIGEDLRNSGINMNFAPVVDVQNNPANPIIGVRAFSNDPAIVTEFGRNMIAGFQEEGIAAVCKHFPGHGDVIIDPHEEIGIVNASKEEITRIHLHPFYQLKDHTDAIMTAHLLFPALDPTNSATFSPLILQDLLRKKWGFEGLIISDSLSMKGAVNSQKSLQEATQGMINAAICAFNAGCDLLILGRFEWAEFQTTKEEDRQMIQDVILGFLQAVKEKRISQKRIDESINRILKLKQKLTEKQISPSKENISPKNIAKKALTLLSTKELFDAIDTTMKGKKVCMIVPQIIKENVSIALKEFDSNFQPDLHFFEPTCNHSQKKTEDLLKAIENSDLTLFLSYNAHLFPSQNSLVQILCQKFPKEKLIIAAVRNPQDAFQNNLFSHHLTLLTYSPSPSSILSLFLCLDNHKYPQGRLPLSENSACESACFFSGNLEK